MRILLWPVSIVAMGLAGSCAPGAGDSPTPTTSNSDAPAPPSHRYAEKSKGVYYYVSAVSDNDRANGKGAGDVSGFKFLGKNDDGEFILGLVDGSEIVGKAYCHKPCAVVRLSNGEKAGFSEDTVIGSAFTDAFNGQLELDAGADEKGPS